MTQTTIKNSQKDFVSAVLYDRSASQEEINSWLALVDSLSSDQIDQLAEVLKAELDHAKEIENQTMDEYLEISKVCKEHMDALLVEWSSSDAKLKGLIDSLQSSVATSITPEQIEEIFDTEEGAGSYLATLSVDQFESMKNAIHTMPEEGEFTADAKQQLLRLLTMMQEEVFRDQQQKYSLMSPMSEGMIQVAELQDCISQLEDIQQALDE